MKILSIIGARPQFVKAAVFRKHCVKNGIEEVLLHTGQHYDRVMSSDIFDELGVKAPDISYDLSARSHGGMTGELLGRIEKTLLDSKPDYVNVYGDTNSTLAGALAAAKLHIPICHIEAGLRSFNKMMPEEINRILTDHVSRYLFCPTFQSVQNLHQENIVDGVHHVGDIMFDAKKLFKTKFRLPKALKLSKKKKIAVMTIHRAESHVNATKLKDMIEYCNRYTREYQIIFPVHPNTRNFIKKNAIEIGQIEIIDPVSYLEIQGILEKADLVITDSGGLQKEAYFHGCECITLRDETEWVETIDSGWNRLWKSHDETMVRKNIEDYGDGDACSKILEVLHG